MPAVIKPAPSRAYEAGSGAAVEVFGSGVGLHLLPPFSMTGVGGVGQSMGAGVHLETMGVGAGTGVGRVHLMVFCVGI